MKIKQRLNKLEMALNPPKAVPIHCVVVRPGDEVPPLRAGCIRQMIIGVRDCSK